MFWRRDRQMENGPSTGGELGPSFIGCDGRGHMTPGRRYQAPLAILVPR